MEKYKYSQHTIRCVGSGGVDTPIPFDEELNSEYEECVGIAAHEISAGGVTNSDYQVGIVYNGEEVIQPTTIHNWSTNKNDGSSPNERFKSGKDGAWFRIRGGQKAKVNIIPRGGAATNTTIEVVFLLRRKETPV